MTAVVAFSPSVWVSQLKSIKVAYVPCSPYNGISDTWSIKPTKLQDNQQRRVAENHSTISSHLACWLQFRGKRVDYKGKRKEVVGGFCFYLQLQLPCELLGEAVCG